MSFKSHSLLIDDEITTSRKRTTTHKLPKAKERTLLIMKITMARQLLLVRTIITTTIIRSNQSN